ncbi:MAG: DNA repair protein RecO [Gammaproteobacteria bacterium]|nr:DNA repair protein RecO [Gammaproteobacteria bacterium]
MTQLRRVELAPAWLLHSYPYRETSLIVEMLTRDYGRVGMVARGARARRRRGDPLQPFTPLRVSFRQRGELATLAAAEASGPGRRFTGKTFLAATYLNELILRLLAREDPSPAVYRLYGEALAALGDEPATVVRRFEGRLIGALGFALPLTHDLGGTPLESDRCYRYDPDHGPMPAFDKQGYQGSMLAAIAAERFEDPAVLAAAGQIFREVISWHLGGRRLKTLDVARSYFQRTD